MNKRKYLSPSSPSIVSSFAIPSHDDIVGNISSAERHIAAEKLMLLRSKYDRERDQWEAIVAQRDREILELRLQVQDAQARCTKQSKEYQEMQAVQWEHVQAVVKELDVKRFSDKKKLETVLSEIKTMTDMVVVTQSKLFAEQEKMNQIRKNYTQRQRQFDEHMHAKTEEMADLQEQMLIKEKVWLTEKSEQAEKIQQLSEDLAALHKVFNQEKIKNEALLMQKNTDIARLQAGVQDAIVHLSQERKEFVELQKKILAVEQRESALQEHVRRLEQDAQMTALRTSKKQ